MPVSAEHLESFTFPIDKPYYSGHKQGGTLPESVIDPGRELPYVTNVHRDSGYQLDKKTVRSRQFLPTAIDFLLLMERAVNTDRPAWGKSGGVNARSKDRQ